MPMVPGYLGLGPHRGAGPGSLLVPAGTLRHLPRSEHDHVSENTRSRHPWQDQRLWRAANYLSVGQIYLFDNRSTHLCPVDP